MYQNDAAQQRLGTKVYECVAALLFEICEDALLTVGPDPELEAESAEDHCNEYEIDDAQDFLGMFDYVVELGVLAAVLLIRLEERVDVLAGWDLLDRLSLVSGWVVQQGEISEYRFDWVASQRSLAPGVAKYQSMLASM